MAYYDGRLNFDTHIDTGGFQKSLASLGKMAAVGAAAVGSALAAGFTAAAKSGMDFEAQISKVQAISGASATEVQALTDKAKQMGIETAFSATQAGEAFQYMAMAGWKTEDMLNGIEGVMNLAAASGEDLGLVSDIVTDALTAFGLQAKDSAHFADVLAAASSNSNTNVSMMGATFKYVAPVAGAMKFSIEDTAHAIGLMANAGIKGEQAGTSLRAMFTRLAKPPKEAGEAIAALGLSITNTDGSFKSLSDIIGQLRIKFGQLTDKQKTQYAAMLAGQEAMSGLLAIVNAAPGDFDKLSIAIDGASGSAKNMAETMLDNLKGQLTLLGSSLEGLGLAIYDGIGEPLKNAVAAAIENINQLTNSINGGELQTAIQGVGELCGNLVTTITGLASSILPLLINALSWLGQNMNVVLSVTGALLVAFKGFAVVQSTITIITGLVNTVKTATAVLKAYTMAIATNNNVSMLLPQTMTVFQLVLGAVTKQIEWATVKTTLLTKAMQFLTSSTGIGLVITLVASLAAGIAIYSSTTENAVDSTDNLIKKMDDMAESYERAKQSAEESTAADLAKLSVVSDTIPRLEELANRTDLTAEEEQELHRIVNGLNEAMPELKLAIYDETNALNMQIGVIWRAVEAYQALAEAKAAESLLVEATKNRMASQKAFDEATEEWETQSSALNKYKNPIQKTIHSIVDNSAGEAYIARQKAAKETLKYMDEETYYKKIFSDLSQKANSALADVKAVQNLSDSGSGGGGGDFSGITSGGSKKSKGSSDAAKKAEKERKERVENYKKTVEDEMDAEKSKFDRLKKLGKVSNKDYLANLAYRADTYRGYADDVLNQDYMTAAEREEIRKDWLGKAADLETEYLLGYIEADKAALDKQVKNGEITQKEYWEKLTALRDKYFVEGSDLWNEYTDEVIEAQKAAITEAYNALAEEALEALNEIEQAQQALEDKLKGFGSTFRQVVIKNAGEHGEDLSYYRLNDFEEQTAQLSAFQTALEQAKERGKDILGDDLTEYFRQFAEMSSVEDATAQLNALLSASDEDFNRSLTGWQKYRKKSEEIAKDFYEDETEELKTTLRQKFDELFEGVSDDFIKDGKLAAEAFGEGFAEQLDEVFRKIQSAIDVNMAGITPSLSAVGGIPVTGYTIDSHDTSIYNLPQTRETTAQNLQAIAAHEEVQRLRGNQ